MQIGRRSDRDFPSPWILSAHKEHFERRENHMVNVIYVEYVGIVAKNVLGSHFATWRQ